MHHGGVEESRARGRRAATGVCVGEGGVRLTRWVTTQHAGERMRGGDLYGEKSTMSRLLKTVTSGFVFCFALLCFALLCFVLLCFALLCFALLLLLLLLLGAFFFFLCVRM